MRRLAGVAGGCLLYSRSQSFESRAIHSGIHRAFFVLGGMTLVSTIVFSGLKRGDSHAVSQRKELHGIENKTGPYRQRSIGNSRRMAGGVIRKRQ